MSENKSTNNNGGIPKKKRNNPDNFFGNGNNKNFIYIALGVFVLFLILNYFSNSGNAKRISPKEFETHVLNGDIKKLNVINRDNVEVYLKSGKTSNNSNLFLSESPEYYFQIGSVEVFVNQLEELEKDTPLNERIPVNYETRTNFLGELIGWLLPLVIIIALWMFMFRRMNGGGNGVGGGIFNVGRSRAKLFDNENTKVKVNFSHVAGMEEAKIEIQEIVDFLKNSDKYTKLGGKIPKGALLVGPPGTGKTLLAKAVAGEANVPFFSLSGSDFVEMFVGVGASRVRDLFAKAKEKSPSIIFIDEIDAIGRARSKSVSLGGNDERENTLNQLLTEMDGFDTNTGVIIIAATNRADVLDSALMRAGRFDRQIYIELPDLTEREEIFKVHMQSLKLSPEVDIQKLSKQTPGFSGADIANVCNEAALIAARRNGSDIIHQDFHDAIDRIIGGLEKKTKIITKTEKKTIAYHEAGHATISWMLEHGHPLVKVTIVPRGQALGAAWYQPHERQITTKEQMLDEICSTLGGRAAEDITFGKISSGALNDLERVTKQAYSMTAYLGMSEQLGNVCFYDSSGRNEYQFQKPYSETTGEKIDMEVKKIITEQYERAKNILLEHKEQMTELAELLISKEVIYFEDAERIFGKRKFTSEYDEEVEKIRKKNKERLEMREKALTKTKEEKTEENTDNSENIN